MSNIKERVLLIAESKNIRKTEFFRDLGLSYANFKGIQKNSALNSDAIVTILSKYPDISPTWLVTGVGDMFQQSDNLARDYTTAYREGDPGDDKETSLVQALQLVIAAQDKTIKSLESQVKALKRELSQLSGGNNRANG